ncbi:unnamed protein product [Schistocephalus solidus]|uniref:ANF_receptor domain-containing protein n=1 Tax=Schistocephalus solidus TaxID=70667 RepID=A0A183S9N9_SCHSO|nr:unnamed protein product [Schistocephalus solidus]
MVTADLLALFGEDQSIALFTAENSDTPALTIRLVLCSLPDTLIGGCAYLALLVFYRELMAEELTTNRSSSAAVIRHLPPVLASYPDVVNSPLLLEALRNSAVTYSNHTIVANYKCECEDKKLRQTRTHRLYQVGFDVAIVSVKTHPGLNGYTFGHGAADKGKILQKVCSQRPSIPLYIPTSKKSDLLGSTAITGSCTVTAVCTISEDHKCSSIKANSLHWVTI